MKFRIFLLLLLLVSYNSYSQSPPVTYISYGLVSIGEPAYVSDDSIAIPVTFRYYEALKRFGLISGANEYYLSPKVNIAYSNANVKKQWYQEYSNNFESARGTSWRRAYSKKIATTDSVVSFTYGIGNLSQSVKGTVYSIQPYFLLKIGLGREQTTSGIAYQDSFSFVIFPPPQPIKNNYISSGNQVICPQGKPLTYTPHLITSLIPTGGDGQNYIMKWQTSSDGAAWYNADTNGYRNPNYLPNTVTGQLPYSTKFYRRIVTSGQQADTSNTISITFLPAGYQPVFTITTEGSTNTAMALSLEINNNIDPYKVTWYDSIPGFQGTVISGVNGNQLMIPVNKNIPGHIYTAKVNYDASCPVYSSRNIHITPPDGDGNYYAAVKIGSQLWMINNLKTTKYNDGTSITLLNPVPNPPRYSWYGDDSLLYANRYGALYNIQVINNAGNKNVCPQGWQVADMMNWYEMLGHIGGPQHSAIMLKSSREWNGPGNQSNAYNFNALPGGEFRGDTYDGKNMLGTWWGMISSQVSTRTLYQSSYFQMISTDDNTYFVDPNGITQQNMLQGQHSIRCISR